MKRRNYFISYAAPDRKWAEWIGWVIEEANFTVLLQAWDLSPGHNFVMQMDSAAKSCDRMIPVMSRSYLASVYANPEWASLFAKDPAREIRRDAGSERLLIPVRVESCDLTGILRPVAWIDLVDCDETDAQNRLLDGLRQQRNKPPQAPRFPGGKREYELLSRPVYPPSEKTFDRRRLPEDDPGSLSIRQGEHFLDRLASFLDENPKYETIAFVDIDGQGAINRKFGRHVGDKVIERVHHTLSLELGGNDTLHRCGDDTFFALLPWDVDMALEELQRILKSICEYHWWSELAPTLRVTCSAAAAPFDLSPGRTETGIHETVLRAAIGCRSARLLGGNRTQKGPLALTPEDRVLKQMLSSKIRNIHSGSPVAQL